MREKKAEQSSPESTAADRLRETSYTESSEVRLENKPIKCTRQHFCEIIKVVICSHESTQNKENEGINKALK